MVSVRGPEYDRWVNDPEQHPNFKRAMAALPEHLRSYWAGVYRARPQLLDLTNTCPKCSAVPFQGCTTPTSYSTRTHKVRLKAIVE